jgi:hypothetical protein
VSGLLECDLTGNAINFASELCHIVATAEKRVLKGQSFTGVGVSVEAVDLDSI